MKNRHLFSIEFAEEVKTYSRKDGLIALVFYLYCMVHSYLFALLMFRTNVYDTIANWLHMGDTTLYQFLFYLPITILEVLPIFVIMRLRKQSLKSIGLKKEKTLKSIFIGLVFSIPFIVPPVIIAIMQGKQLASLPNLIWLFLFYFLIIGFAEELVFRGYLQTRLQGLIKGKWLSIVITGLLFTLTHIPFQMVSRDLGLLEFIMTHGGMILITFPIHIYLVYIYTRDQNILSVTITHTFINLMGVIFI